MFRLILNPEREGEPEVSRRLRRLNEWGTTTVRPLLLHLLQRRADGSASSAQIAKAMQYIESFLVRRLLIGRATASLNRILMGAVTEMSADSPVHEAVWRYLSTGRKYYATDTEVASGIKSIPFYLNGRPYQRSLILRWLEESYHSKEPVDTDQLTIEHVLPQTPTPSWQRMLQDDLQEGERLDQVYESILHTLGNLTLTGYNTPLSNRPFSEKREKLKKSGLAMNQEIAEQETWGRPQIMARARALFARAQELWPAPVAMTGHGEAGVPWELINQSLAAMPRGTWTTYGDLAALAGTHPVPVGQRLASHPLPNAHRVLQVDGTISPNFRWLDPARTDNPQDILRQEDVSFDEHGHADPNQRLTVDDLARLVGLAVDETFETIPDPDPGGAIEQRDRFLSQLSDAQAAEVTHGVIAFLDLWVKLGGTLSYGQSATTSCFILPPVPERAASKPWPFTVYPSGKCEIVFQHMLTRPPFDDAGLREEFRSRLNAIEGIDVPAGKLELRPGFPLTVFASETSNIEIIRTLCWFTDKVWQHHDEPADWLEVIEKAISEAAALPSEP